MNHITAMCFQTIKAEKFYALLFVAKNFQTTCISYPLNMADIKKEYKYQSSEC